MMSALTDNRESLRAAARILEHNQDKVSEVLACPWATPKEHENAKKLGALSEAVFRAVVFDYLRRMG
jgi:hypothetical protein